MNEISYEGDISEDPKSNYIISNLSVPCPFAGCTEMYEMRHLHDHLLCCNKSRSNCLFHILGCEWPMMNNEEEDKHLDTDRKKHYRMMIDVVCSLKHNFETVHPNQIEIENIGNEINRLKKETAEIRNAMCEREATFHNTDSGRSDAGSELETIKLNFNTMKEDIAQLKEGRETDGIKLAQMELELATLKQNREEDRQKIVSNEREISKIKMDRQNLKSELEEVKKDTATYQEKIVKIKDELNRFIHEKNIDKRKIISMEEIVAKIKEHTENDRMKVEKEMNDLAVTAARECRERSYKIENELAQFIKDRETERAKIVQMERELKQLKNEIEEERKSKTLLKDDKSKTENDGSKKQSREETNVAVQQNITPKTKEVAQIEEGASSSRVSQRRHQCGFSDLRGMRQFEKRFSDPFVIGRYRMRVQIDRWWDNGGFLISLCLSPPNIDDAAQWPMKMGLRLSLVDSDSGRQIRSSTFSHATSKNKKVYDRPTNVDILIRDSQIFFDFCDHPGVNAVTVTAEVVE